MRRISLFSFAALLALAAGPSVTARQDPARFPAHAAGSTCAESEIDPESYKLTTEAQALNVLRPREPWWEPYGVWQGPREIGHPSEASVRLAERAKEIDDGNLLAHGYLARQYVALAVDAQKAEDAWKRVLDHGGAIVWTATLSDVDARSFFVVAFDRRGIRLFRFGEMAGPLRTHFGVPDFPGPERTDFWRALGGCLPPNAVADLEIPWSGVREIRPTSAMLRFELLDRVEITSDRGNRRSDDRIEMFLHPQPGVFDFRFGMAPFMRPPFGVRPVGADPAAYQLRVRQMLGTFFDPAAIARASARP